MNKAFLSWLICTAVLIIVGLLVIAGKDTTGVLYKVSGIDAFEIAASRPMYWIFILVAIAATYFGIRKVNKLVKEEADGFAIHGLSFLIAAFLVVCIFWRPADIKADPIGSGATTEQIEKLRAKGMDK